MIVKKAMGHYFCIIAQAGRVRKGESLCFLPDLGGVAGEKSLPADLVKVHEGRASSIFCLTGNTSPYCERYKRTPEQVNAF